jgi:hypothetical protein
VGKGCWIGALDGLSAGAPVVTGAVILLLEKLQAIAANTSTLIGKTNLSRNKVVTFFMSFGKPGLSDG